MSKLDTREIHLKAVGNLKDWARRMMLKKKDADEPKPPHAEHLDEHSIDELADEKAHEMGPVTDVDAPEEGDEGHQDLHHLPGEPDGEVDDDDLKPTITVRRSSRGPSSDFAKQMHHFSKNKKKDR